MASYPPLLTALTDRRICIPLFTPLMNLHLLSHCNHCMNLWRGDGLLQIHCSIAQYGGLEDLNTWGNRPYHVYQCNVPPKCRSVNSVRQSYLLELKLLAYTILGRELNSYKVYLFLFLFPLVFYEGSWGVIVRVARKISLPPCPPVLFLVICLQIYNNNKVSALVVAYLARKKKLEFNSRYPANRVSFDLPR